MVISVDLVWSHGLKNDECFKCSALVSLQGFENDVYFICVAFVSPNDFKNDVHFMCSAFVWPRGLKNDECYMHMALRTTYVSCVVRLFHLVALRTTKLHAHGFKNDV